MEKPQEEEKMAMEVENNSSNMDLETASASPMEVEQNADEILNEEEVASPAPMEESPELSFPKQTRRAKCPPGCMRKPKCSSKGGKKSKKNKTKKSKKARKSRKSKK